MNILEVSSRSLSKIDEISDEHIISVRDLEEVKEQDKVKLFDLYDIVYRIGHLMSYLGVEHYGREINTADLLQKHPVITELTSQELPPTLSHEDSTALVQQLQAGV